MDAGVSADAGKCATKRQDSQQSAVLRFGLLAIIIIYLALALGYNAQVPMWNAPDEPAHYNYVRHLAEGRGLPVLKPGDWDQDYQSKIVSAQFPAELSIDPIRYEFWQPPLYYTIAAPVYAATTGLEQQDQVFALRLLSTLLGALLLLVAYATLREVFPRERFLPLMGVAFIALVPMYGAMTAAISNDHLANLLLSLVLLLVIVLANPARRQSPELSPGWIRWLTSRWWHAALALGVLLGLIVVTKSTAYTSAVLVAVGGLWIYRHDWAGLFKSLGLTYLVALIVGGWWFVRNAITYGNLDITGLRNHDMVVVGQPKTGVLDFAALGELLRVTFHSFWAQFGWMGVPADERAFRLLGLLCALVALGLLIFCLRAWRGRGLLMPFQWQALAFLMLALLLTLALFIGYNLTYIQHQGRYLFPAMIPFAVLFALGIKQLAPSRLEPALYGVVTACLVVLNLYCLFRVVGPAFGG